MCHRRKNMGNLKTLSCIWFFGGIEFPEYVLVSCICWFLFSAASGKSTHCLSSLPERGVCRLTISAGKKKKTKRKKKKKEEKRRGGCRLTISAGSGILSIILAGSTSECFPVGNIVAATICSFNNDRLQI